MDRTEKYLLTHDDEVLLELGTGDLTQVPHRKVPSSPDEKSTLTSLIDMTMRGTVGVGQAVANKDLVSLVLKPELQRARRAGAEFVAGKGGAFGAQLFQNTEKGNRIIGNAQFKPADAVRVVNIVGAAWQVAAVATAQHYMAEIDTKLKNVSEGVRGLAEFLNNQRNAELAAAQDTLRRDLRVYLDDPTSEEDRRILTETLHRVFELAHGNTELRIKNIRSIVEKMRQGRKEGAFEEAEPEAQAFLFALSVGAQALAASLLAGQSESRLHAFKDSFTQVLGSFEGTIQALEAEYQNCLQANQPAQRQKQALWQKPLPHNVVRQFKNRRQDQQHERWKDANEHLSAATSNFRTQLGTVGDSLDHLMQYGALPQEAEGDTVLLVRLNQQGEVEEVFVPVGLPQ